MIGIWPRFIEPKLLCTSHHTLGIPTLPQEFHGLKILQISDLHFSSYCSENFIQRISRQIQKLAPDIICFTGDLLSYAELVNTDCLLNFLSSLRAPLGCFAIYGNHDYSDYVSYGTDGSYTKIRDHVPALLRGFARLFSPKLLTPSVILHEPVAPSQALQELFESAGFTVLHNKTIQIGNRRQKLNITGLGDLIAGHCDPNTAFLHHDPEFPTIVLSHNPDSYPYLAHYPGDLILCGHTHGGQVNLPYIWEKVTPLKHLEFKSGLVVRDGRYIYINRGLGSTFPFRWFAPPEITLFKLHRNPVETARVQADLFSTCQDSPDPVFKTMQHNE